MMGYSRLRAILGTGMLAAFLSGAGVGSAAAQTGAISGRVVEAAGGSGLASAQLRLVGPGVGTLSNSTGAFALNRVPVGTHELIVSYVGYTDVRQPVTVRAGETAERSIRMEVSAVELDGVVVYGAATRGQAEALQRQRTSLQITNVVSEELFNRFPDRNAAETVRRLPGISVDRDQGEGEYVQIRGVDQEYNSLTINGIRIPAPDEADGQRSVGLDLINNSLLGEIEVVKAISPNMDADAVGGVVNFGLRRAPQGGVGSLSAGFGLNDQTSDFNTLGSDIQDFAGIFGTRSTDGRFGLLLDGAYFKTARDSKLREFEYDDGDGSIDDVIFAQHTNDYDVHRQRFGGSATLDFVPAVGSEVYGTASYNVYLDDEVRRLVDFNIDDGEETRETRNRLEDQRVALFMAGGSHDLGSVLIDYKGAWIRSTEELPDRTYLRYQRDVPLDQFSNDQIKGFDGTTTFTGADAPTLNRIRWDDMLKRDQDASFQTNFTVPFSMGGSRSTVQFGGKFLRKDVSFDRVRFQMTSFSQPSTLGEGEFGFEDVRYDGAALQPLLTDWGDERNVTDDYEATEDVASVYAMATINPSASVSVLLGGRYEDTSTEYQQPNPETESAPLTGSGGYGNFMPSVHLTIRPDDRSNIRLAYTTGLARPRYQDLVPRRVVDEDELTISYGNPDLEPRTADNLDFMYERYTSRLGMVSAGVFYKRFRAFQTTRRFNETIGTDVYEATQKVMGDGTASYFGVEFAFNQRLSGIAPALADFSLFGNYNYTHSEGEVGGRMLPLTNSPEHTGNLSILYDNAGLGLSFVVAGNYRDALLIGVGDAEHNDVYFDAEFQLDLSVTKSISDRLVVSGQVNGLTANEEHQYLGDPSLDSARLLQWEQYGPYATVTLQYQFR